MSDLRTPKRCSELPQWLALQQHHDHIRKQRIADLFVEDQERFENFSLRFEGILLDYSKNLLSSETRRLLLELVRTSEVESWRSRMFSGEKINHTEERAVLHTALRAPADKRVEVDGENVIPEVHRVLQQMESFVERIHCGRWRGYSGFPITDIVNIGIGGSDLGPRMVVHALAPWQHPRIRSHFVSNLDGRELESTLQKLNPETTLFLVASKTFTTLETMTNANSARNWFLQSSSGNGGGTEAIRLHFVAISTNLQATRAFGIADENVFSFWDWVGGRYSLWSAIGLSIALAIGMKQFRALLAGAEAMDQHFQQAPLEQNMPVLLAMIGIWNLNFLCSESHAIIPYDTSLELFPPFLQQLDMESNGKQIDRDGRSVDYQTSPLLWGEPGSNGQHSFFQFLHQSPVTVPIDFIGTIHPEYELDGHHDRLTANMFAQAESLMNGKQRESVLDELDSLPLQQRELLAPYKTFPGNIPSNLILLDRLDPRTLGSLIALYEHKIFVQGVVWNLNSFDQMGVELGKALAKRVQQELQSAELDRAMQPHDNSTAHLINTYLLRKQALKNRLDGEDHE